MHSSTQHTLLLAPFAKAGRPAMADPSRSDGATLLLGANGQSPSALLTSARPVLSSRPGLSLCLVTDYPTWRGLCPEHLKRESGHPGIVAIAADRLDEATAQRAHRAVDRAVAMVRAEEVVRFVVARLGRPQAGEALEELLAMPVDQADPSRQRSLRRQLRKHTSLGILEWTHLIRLARCPRLGRSVGAIAADLAITTVTLRKWTQHLLGMPPSEFAARPGLPWVLQLALQRSGALTG